MAIVAHAGTERQSGRKLSAVQLKKLPPGMHADGDGLYLDVQTSGLRSRILRTTVEARQALSFVNRVLRDRVEQLLSPEDIDTIDRVFDVLGGEE